jgi:hypothetical protein
MISLDAVHDYYGGQRTVAIAGALAGLAWLLVARAAYTRKARAFAITLFLIAGGFMLPVNAVYFFYIGPQAAGVEAMLARDSAAFHASEEVHLDEMLRGFRRSYSIDGTLVLVGLLGGAAGFIARSKRWVGIGLALALCDTTLLAGEMWSRQRALQYQEALRSVFTTSSRP